MTKRIWSCDVTIYYKWSHREDRLKMKFENVEGNTPLVCYQSACDSIGLINRELDEKDLPTMIILGGCTKYNFEE